MRIAMALWVWLFVLISGPLSFQAIAACGVTYTFSNGTTADATQVNKNFSDLTSCAAPQAVPTFSGTATFAGAASPAIQIINDAVTSDAIRFVDTHAGGKMWLMGPGTGTGLPLFTLGFNYTDYVMGPAIAPDGSFLVGTTAAGGWAGSSSVAFQRGGSGRVLSLYATSASTDALDVRADSESSALISFRSNATSVGLFTSAGSDITWKATSVAYVFAGGSGGVSLSSGATSWAAVSDERLKNWNVPQSSYRAAIQSLWIGDYDLFDSFARTGAFKTRFGVRAQQAYGVLPANIRDMAIHPGDATTPWTASSEPFAYLALWGVKDIYSTQAMQKRDISILEARLAAEEKSIAELRRANLDLQAALREFRRQRSIIQAESADELARR